MFLVHTSALFVASVSCCAWVYLALARGGFWRLSEPPADATPSQHSSSAPSVAVIIPARNEAPYISAVVESLLRQDYPGEVRVFVVDDHSSDGTLDLMSRFNATSQGRVIAISSKPLPSSWTGKMWALFQGIEAAGGFGPDYFFFSDADVVHSSGSLRSLVNLAESGTRDLVSMMPKLACSTFAGRALLPAFVFYFFMLYPPRWVNRPGCATAAAAGGNVLVRAKALSRIGGITKIRHELIDDCALAREIKKIGKIRLGWTTSACSIRSYEGYAEIGRMISRNAFYQLNHSLVLLAASVTALTVVFVAPVILIFGGGWIAGIAFSAWVLMSYVYWPTLKGFSLSALWAPLLPLTTSFYLAATIYSAVEYYRGRGGQWKGRTQDTFSHNLSKQM